MHGKADRKMQLRSSTVQATKRSASAESEKEKPAKRAKTDKKVAAKKTGKQAKAKAKAETKVVKTKKEHTSKAEPKKEAKQTPGELEIGDAIPEDVVLEDQNSKQVNLLQLAKKAHILVVFVYPRASTPGCTRQAKGFRDEYDELTKKFKATVVGLSADSPKAQQKFIERQSLQYDLLCDPGRSLIATLGCKKHPKGTIRSHFIFVDGVLQVKKVKVSPEVSYKGALEQVKEIVAGKK